MSVACELGSYECPTDTLVADDELVELALVLPRWQVDALATAARQRGMTAGQVLRRLIGGYCARETPGTRPLVAER